MVLVSLSYFLNNLYESLLFMEKKLSSFSHFSPATKQAEPQPTFRVLNVIQRG